MRVSRLIFKVSISFSLRCGINGFLRWWSLVPNLFNLLLLLFDELSCSIGNSPNSFQCILGAVGLVQKKVFCQVFYQVFCLVRCAFRFTCNLPALLVVNSRSLRGHIRSYVLGLSFCTFCRIWNIINGFRSVSFCSIVQIFTLVFCFRSHSFGFTGFIWNIIFGLVSFLWSIISCFSEVLFGISFCTLGQIFGLFSLIRDIVLGLSVAFFRLPLSATNSLFRVFGLFTQKLFSLMDFIARKLL